MKFSIKFLTALIPLAASQGDIPKVATDNGSFGTLVAA
eukprot:CAMPEP_0194180696 /NCGR_PEP_ID=MMETSP0154-20130528/17681_1 /TAXON_ID=1049557 /ORGANISM="Thalassiothrix antarctica, Strain L6-D1" /LENGTH=37 /DNA_ID= /DNA_START= /DNA_END= /DNA_ORIENTATION=